ncbi:MAG: sugar ABC transporter permease [Anaerolineae bacterium]|nr:sugar ABC transporter permease [Anaerolineae bacterium]
MGHAPNKAFLNALGNNIIIMISVTVGVILIALPLALAMNRATRGVTAFRSLLLLPMVTAGIAVYYVWSLIYQPDGLLNSLLRAFGLEALAPKDGWLANIHTALPALIVVMIWAGVPLAMLLYLAGLQTIPQELMEASIVDGAGAWDRLRRIVWPLLRPVTVIIIITTLSTALQGYEMPLLMTDGGPTDHTMVVGLLVYKKAFGGWGTPAMGAASAYGWILFILGLGLSVLSLRSMRALD